MIAEMLPPKGSKTVTWFGGPEDGNEVKVGWSETSVTLGCLMRQEPADRRSYCTAHGRWAPDGAGDCGLAVAHPIEGDRIIYRADRC